jgi:hypothetical protein
MLAFSNVQWAQKCIQSLPKSKQIQLTISWVLDKLEKCRFLHFTQHGQCLKKIQYQIFTTSGLSAAGLQSCNIFGVCFSGKKITPCRHG